MDNRRSWPDWSPCDFSIFFEGQDCRVVKFRRIHSEGINRAIYELVIERESTASLLTVEMHTIPNRIKKKG